MNAPLHHATAAIPNTIMTTDASLTSSTKSPTAMPGIQALYWCDFVFQLACNATVIALIVALMVHWLKPPTPPDPTIYYESPPEAFVREWGSTVAGGIAGLALIAVIRRYRWVKKVLSKGTLIKGRVMTVEIRKYDAHASLDFDERRWRGPRIVQNYYVDVRYTAGGGEWQVMIGLPGSPKLFKVFAGEEVDLLVLDSSPRRPLLREVYLWQPRPFSLRALFLRR
jgi:hypothetical protein